MILSYTFYSTRGNDKVTGKGAKFMVDPKIDKLFYVEGLNVGKEDAYRRIDSEEQEEKYM